MMGQKLGDPINGMLGYAAEDIFEPSEWIDATKLAGSDEAAQHGSGSTSHIAAEEQPIAATDLIPHQRMQAVEAAGPARSRVGV